MQYKHLRHLVISASFLYPFLYTGASAQTAPPVPSADTGQGLSEITVTARRTAENLQSVPVAITAFSNSALERASVRTVSDLSKLVPGVLIEDFGTGPTLLIAIRGQVNTRIQAGQDPSVAFYFNDVPLGIQAGWRLGLFDINEVQVLKGPQGTLFGHNSPGGALVINPMRPDDKFDGYIKVGGEFCQICSGFVSEGAINIPVTPKLSFRLAFQTEDVGGFAKNVAPSAIVNAYGYSTPGVGTPTKYGNQGNNHEHTIRFGALWKPTDTIENYFLYQGSIVRSDGSPYAIKAVNNFSGAGSPGGTFNLFYNTLAPLVGLPPLNGSLATLAQTQFNAQKSYFWSFQSAYDPRAELTQHLVSDITTVNLGSVTVKNIAGYRHVVSNRTSDIAGLPVELTNIGYKEGGHEISDELQILGKSFDNKLSWVAGLSYFNNESLFYNQPIILYQGVFGGLSSALAPSNILGVAYSQSYAGYAHGVYQIPWLDGLSLTLGARYTVDKRQGDLTNYYTINGVNHCSIGSGSSLPPVCNIHDGATFRAPVYTASLDYTVDRNTLVYLASRRGYRSGGFNLAASDALGFGPFKPEYVIDVEFGFKKETHIGTVPVRTNFAVYHQFYTDIQREVINPVSLLSSTVLNAAGASVNGFELAVDAVPVKGLQLAGSVAYVDPKYSKFIDGPYNYSSFTFADVPKWTFTINASYKLPVSSNWGIVRLSGDYSWQSRYFFDDAQQGPFTTSAGVSYQAPVDSLSQAPYGLMALRLDWQSMFGSEFSSSLWVKNAFDQKAYAYGVPLFPTLGVETATFVKPRFFGMDVKYSF